MSDNIAITKENFISTIIAYVRSKGFNNDAVLNNLYIALQRKLVFAIPTKVEICYSNRSLLNDLLERSGINKEYRPSQLEAVVDDASVIVKKPWTDKQFIDMLKQQ